MTHRPVLLAVRALAVLLLATAVLGQGADTLPAPLSTPELMRCADEMQLSPEQRLRIIPFHDAYLQQSERLWRTEIPRFLNELLAARSQLEGDRPRIPERWIVEGLIRQYEALLSRVDGLDATLFDAIGSVLAEEQLPRLRRAREGRRIHVLGHGAMEVARKLNPALGVDLPDLVKQLDLSPEERARADIIIDGHQGSLLANIREMRREMKDAMDVLLDTVDELGLRRKSAREMRKIAEDEERREAVQEKLDAAARPLQVKIHAVSRLNLRTLRAFLEVLSAENAAQIRRLYYEKVYSRSDAGPGRWRHRFDRAVKLEELSDEVRRQIQLQRAGFTGQEDALVDRLVELVEESRRRRGFTLLFDDVFQAPDDPRGEEIGKLRERRVKLTESANAALDAILGPELLAVLEPAGTAREVLTVGELFVLLDRFGGGPSTGSFGSTAYVTTNFNFQVGEQSINVPYERFHAAIMDRADAQTTFARALLMPTAPPDPDPIGREEFEQYCLMLGLGDEDRMVVESLYEDYHASAEDALSDAAEEDVDGEGARRGTFAIVHRLDGQLFDDVGVALNTEHSRLVVDRLHGVRERTLYRDLTRGSLIAWLSDKASADFAAMACALASTSRALEDLAPVLDSYDDVATPLLRSRYDLAKTIPDSDDWDGAQRQFSASLEQLEQLNEQTLRAAADRLAPAVAAELRYAFNQAAHPRLFREASDVETQIAAALGLADLTDGQRERIFEIAARFRDRYRVRCEQLVALKEEAESASEATEQEALKRELDYERLNFLKDDAAARARTELRLILSEAQAGSVAKLDRAW